MAYKKKSYYGKQPNQPVKVTKISSSDTVQSIKKDKHSTDSEDTTNRRNPIVKKGYWKLSNADTIALGMLLVTIVLAWYTFGLYESATEDSKITKISSNAANKSAEIAGHTLDEIKKYNTASLEKQQIALDKSDQTNRDNFDRIDKSLSIQDSSLKETQKEFDINNAPFLQMKISRISKIEVGKQIDIGIIVENLGAYTAQTIKSNVVCATKNIPPTIEEVNAIVKHNDKFVLPEGSYISKGNPIENELYKVIDSLNERQYKMLMDEKWFIYMGGNIEYINLANGKRKKYIYMIKINGKKGAFIYVWQKNPDVK
jgi:hypothetical protein